MIFTTDGEAEHPDNIPRPSGLVLTGDVGWHGNVGVKHRAREKHGKTDCQHGTQQRPHDLQSDESGTFDYVCPVSGKK
jgi:hypothetical protein